jgi:hypothetical protein
VNSGQGTLNAFFVIFAETVWSGCFWNWRTAESAAILPRELFENGHAAHRRTENEETGKILIADKLLLGLYLPQELGLELRVQRRV